MRRIVVEAAWSYRHRPGVRATLRRRLDGQPAAIQVISWRAQQRLCHKYLITKASLTGPIGETILRSRRVLEL